MHHLNFHPTKAQFRFLIHSKNPPTLVGIELATSNAQKTHATVRILRVVKYTASLRYNCINWSSFLIRPFSHHISDAYTVLYHMRPVIN